MGILDAAQAAYEGYPDLVKLMYEATGQHPRENNITMVSAVTSGDIELVQWLLQRLEMEPSKGMAEAAAKGHLGMIRWMYEQGYGLEEDGGVLLRAAEEGYMDIVRWIIDRDWANEELDTDDEYDNYNDDWLGAEYVIRESFILPASEEKRALRSMLQRSMDIWRSRSIYELVC
ncbi:hypothetical protein PHYPSEUDO_006277 [Phytophthora pseudosyringae]|uniref:Uncharacterized protein n=1 Tax=Phytophthora pseudosyringae TaxID=221518 RepID=A0A8T1VMF6_9STRA|nr:hypothetical protein PHYPSEUDO_006277 [Phytophthora pseudosyringae]